MRAGEDWSGNLGGHGPGQGQGCPDIDPPPSALCLRSKTLQRNRKMAMGRKKFNMDPKKVLGATGLGSSLANVLAGSWHRQVPVVSW